MKHKIGRIDKADFPALSLENIPLKVDTGAFTSTVHCHEIKEVKQDGKICIQFRLLDPDHVLYTGKLFEFETYDKKVVKSSFGDSEERFVIKTSIILFDTKYPIDLTLSERSDMKYPILLGRKFLTKKFIVDTEKTNRSYKQKKNKQ